MIEFLKLYIWLILKQEIESIARNKRFLGQASTGKQSDFLLCFITKQILNDV